ncbi:MAG: hypothetical protein ACLTMP_07850 [Eggerthella lenta]
MQKEVADRMAASPGTKNYGAYTVKLRCTPSRPGASPGRATSSRRRGWRAPCCA